MAEGWVDNGPADIAEGCDCRGCPEAIEGWLWKPLCEASPNGLEVTPYPEAWVPARWAIYLDLEQRAHQIKITLVLIAEQP